MQKHIANITSAILIPLLAPVYLFIIEVLYFPELLPGIVISHPLLSLFYIVIVTTIIPFLFVFILYKLKKITSLTLEKREDRALPQLFSSTVYVLNSLVLAFIFGIRNALTLSMISVTLSLLIITFLTRYWKISTHSSGAIGMLSIISILFYKYPSSQFMVTYLILSLALVYVCYARYYLKVHTLNQVLAGCLLGILIGTGLFYFIPIEMYR